jgi:hypothetical protein
MLVLGLALGSGLAHAAATPGQKCAVAKNKAASKKVVAKLKCWQKAIAAGLDNADAACLTAAETKFTDSISKAEAKGGCAISGDAAAIESAVDTCVGDLVALTPGGNEGACYSGATAEVGPVFLSGMLTSLAAGDAECSADVAAGSHVCTYAELLNAQTFGDLATVPDTTTFWLQRDTTADVNAIPSPPGPGGNCNNWTFNGNHLADGEYVTFAGGVPFYHLDADTVYDGVSTSHVDADLPCGGTTRSIPCCAPCAP